MAQITVLLAAYNGSAFLSRQIDSVLSQTFSSFHLILSDDGSTDTTADLLDTYAQKYPDKITHYRSGVRFGCAQRHFMHLLERFHDTPYIMFCDQDDVWHPDKMEKTLQTMRSIESDPGVPTLVHTDLRVVDGELRETAPSFCELSHLDGRRTGLHQLLAQNVVTGCTVMINRSLAELACGKPVESGVLMHDWWLALLAAAAGNVGFLPEPTIDYRQHGHNSVGAKNARSAAYLWKRFTDRDARQVMIRTARQADLFLAHYREILSPEQIAMLTDFAHTADARWLRRVRVYLKYRILKYGCVRVIAQLLGG